MKQKSDSRQCGATLSVTISREGARIHRLIDDVNYPLRLSKAAVRRDPMVEALFGAAKQVAQQVTGSSAPAARKTRTALAG